MPITNDKEIKTNGKAHWSTGTMILLVVILTAGGMIQLIRRMNQAQDWKVTISGTSIPAKGMDDAAMELARKPLRKSILITGLGLLDFLFRPRRPDSRLE